MAKIQLTKSDVIFKEDTHQYFLPSGKELQGITGVISRQLFPHEYDAVPDKVLTSAADYGHQVHHSLQIFDEEFQHDGSVEVQDYVDLLREKSFVHEASEYLITDGENYASACDKVYRTGDNIFSIADIKTYYGKITGDKLMRCRWQLSIYAYLFELQNKKAKVDKLFVIHIRNKQKKDGTFDHIREIIYVDRIPSDLCKELLDCDLRGEQFKDPFALPEGIEPQLKRVKELVEIKSEAEQELNSLKANILETMTFLDVKTWANSEVRLTRKLPGTRTSLNTNLLKAEHPEIDFSLYERTSQVSGSLLIAV